MISSVSQAAYTFEWEKLYGPEAKSSRAVTAPLAGMCWSGSSMKKYSIENFEALIVGAGELQRRGSLKMKLFLKGAPDEEKRKSERTIGKVSLLERSSIDMFFLSAANSFIFGHQEFTALKPPASLRSSKPLVSSSMLAR